MGYPIVHQGEKSSLGIQWKQAGSQTNNFVHIEFHQQIGKINIYKKNRKLSQILNV